MYAGFSFEGFHPQKGLQMERQIIAVNTYFNLYLSFIYYLSISTVQYINTVQLESKGKLITNKEKLSEFLHTLTRFRGIEPPQTLFFCIQPWHILNTHKLFIKNLH